MVRRNDPDWLLDRLRAEIAVLRAGNETLRRVNAELVQQLERPEPARGARVRT